MYVEWDEPGAGGIVVNGERCISFGIDTDWADTWHPVVSAAGLAFIDQLPRLVQEHQMAQELAQRLEAERDALARKLQTTIDKLNSATEIAASAVRDRDQLAARLPPPEDQ